jgi:hypothetical protein
MNRKIVLICLCTLYFVHSKALVAIPTQLDSNNIISTRISILTCGAGAELYSSWGHSAIRVIDSFTKTDEVINYGMFDFNDPLFYWKYVKGTLLYYGDKEPFQNFMGQYAMEGREVKEQVLDLNFTEKSKLLAAINFSLKPENREYHYDFLYNNCSTKLRDMLDSVLKPQLMYGQVIAKDSLKYMHDLNSYLQNKPWDRLGIDMLLSSEVNKKVTNFSYMYLPEALFRALNKTTNAGRNLVNGTNILLPNAQSNAEVINTPKYLFAGVSLLFLLATYLKPQSKLLQIADALFFTLIGLLGCLFLFMWLGTNHLQTKHNLNLLWCLPTHIAMCYFIFSKKNYTNYFIFSLVCTVISALLAIFYSTAWEVYPLIIIAAIRLYYRIKIK